MFLSSSATSAVTGIMPTGVSCAVGFVIGVVGVGLVSVSVIVVSGLRRAVLVSGGGGGSIWMLNGGDLDVVVHVDLGVDVHFDHCNTVERIGTESWESGLRNEAARAK